MGEDKKDWGEGTKKKRKNGYRKGPTNSTLQRIWGTLPTLLQGPWKRGVTTENRGAKLA